MGELGFLVIGLIVGVIGGVVIEAKARARVLGDDRGRLDAIEVLGWTVAQSNGRWAVLKTTGDEMKVLGSTQATLRQAIDAATEIEHKAAGA